MFDFIKDRYQTLRLSIRHLNRIDPNVMIFVIYGMLYDTMLNLYNPFTAKYLERLGGNSMGVSLLNAVPGLVAIFVLLPGLFIIGRFRAKKRITAIFFLLSRVILLLAVFIPFLPREYRAMTFIILISAMNFPNAVSQTSLQSFLGEVFDGRMRSTAISMRTKFGNVLIPLVTLTTGLIIGYIPQTDNQRLITYQVFFFLAFIVGMFEVRTFLRFNEKEPPQTAPSDDDEPQPKKPTLREQIAVVGEVMRNKEFIAYLIPAIVFYFAWHSGWALGMIYFIEDLQANEFWIAIFLVASGITAFLSAGRWNRLIQRRGNDLALLLGAIGLTLNLTFYIFSKNVYTMVLCHLFGGIVTTGFSIAVLNGLLAATPDKHRIIYIGVFNTFVNISLAIAPLVAQIFITKYGTWETIIIVVGMRVVGIIPLILYVRKRRKAKAAADDSEV